MSFKAPQRSGEFHEFKVFHEKASSDNQNCQLFPVALSSLALKVTKLSPGQRHVLCFAHCQGPVQTVNHVELSSLLFLTKVDHFPKFLIYRKISWIIWVFS